MPRYQGNQVASAQHLRAWIGCGNADCRVFFWRTRGGSEVDFVLYGADGFHAIEVNDGRSLRPADLRGITTFHRDYPDCSGDVAGGGRPDWCGDRRRQGQRTSVGR